MWKLVAKRCCKKYNCNMSNPETANPLEAQILAELASIERRITNLTGEREALRRMLTRVRQQRFGNLAVTRRNSHARILIENEVLDALREANDHSLATHQLLRAATGVNPELKKTTFRSHLHRMKKRGLIRPRPGQRGVWTLPPTLRV